MIKENIKYPAFSGTDFIRLYCAINFKKSLSPIIKHHELEKRLYGFYSMPEFSELFQDVCPKRDYVCSENNYLDLGTALNTAQLFGILMPIHAIGETRSIISCDENIAEQIIENFDEGIVTKMSDLFNVMFDLDNKSNEKEGPMLIKKAQV